MNDEHFVFNRDDVGFHNKMTNQDKKIDRSFLSRFDWI